MALGFRLRLHALFTISLSISLTLAVTTPSTNTPVPPLQWIELTNLLSGSSPPGLKYASIGFDSGSSTLLIFGGESNGFPEQQTYLLNVQSLTWSNPEPVVQANVKPPARSMAIYGDDFAASNRHGHVVIGGMGSDGQPLSDAWEFDYINHFWSEISISPGGPSARFGASGGTDLTAAPVADLSVPGPNNTFYLAGGNNGGSIVAESELWKFEVAGVLTSNNVNDTVGSWTQLESKSQLPSRVREGSTVMPSAQVVLSGGCDSNASGDSCAQQDSHVISVGSSSVSLDGCPAPRVGPVLVPNFNNFSQTFDQQAIMLLGLFNDTQWDDGNGLARGEVDILTIDAASWTRILPSGDPQDDGSLKFPVPREGAVAYSSAKALFGNDATVASDIVVFGGQDANGTYLNDVWLLRSYHAALTSSNATWSAFGDGTLSTGVQASGSGVTIQYLSSCASPIGSSSISSGSSTSPTSPTSPTSSSPSSGSSNASVQFPFDAALGHKALSPISLTILLVTILAFRFSAPSASNEDTGVKLLWLTGLLVFLAYVSGIVGLVLSFTTITSTASVTLSKRSSSGTLLKTGHGKAALALFIVLYILLPFLAYFRLRSMKKDNTTLIPSRQEPVTSKNLDETGFSGLATPGKEKPNRFARATSSSPDLTSNNATIDSAKQQRRSRTRSLFSGNMWPGLWPKENGERPSMESAGHESSASQVPQKSFEVMNRANRVRRLSSNGLNGHSTEEGHTLHSAQPSVVRTLSDLDWLDRRQNVAAFDELDYALGRLNHQRAVSTVAGDSGPLLPPQKPISKPTLPPRPLSLLHALFHAALLGSCAVTLVSLFQRAPKAVFAVFLVWVIVFYCVFFSMSWRGMPKESLLSVLLDSLKRHPVDEAISLPDAQSRASSRPLSATNDNFPPPGWLRSPYTYHQPSFRRALSPQEDEILSSNSHRYAEDEDEETQQRRIEEEMGRRDVSIITVPKRKLWIANPS